MFKNWMGPSLIYASQLQIEVFAELEPSSVGELIGVVIGAGMVDVFFLGFGGLGVVDSRESCWFSKEVGIWTDIWKTL